MTGPTIGELFTGYGGIGLGVKQVWPDAEVRWVSDVCKFDKDGNAGHHNPHRGPCRVLAHHYPGIPNLGDVTKVDWSKVERVTILTGGSPCQDLSHLGKRAGMKPGTRSGLWASMCDAIEALQPSLVIWENVKGALSAEATIGDVEQCDVCMDEPGGGTMRALGRVLGDLADIGYDAWWVGLRAADVGAPHGRFRIFVLAAPANASGAGDWRDQYARGMGGQNPQALRGDNDHGEPATMRSDPVPNDTDTTYDFGPFQKAVTRWEGVLGRKAPYPLDETRYTTAAFSEWSMGLPEGWVTQVPGVTEDEAKALCGNGVVPQQCAAAVRWLLGQMESTRRAA